MTSISFLIFDKMGFKPKLVRRGTIHRLNKKSMKGHYKPYLNTLNINDSYFHMTNTDIWKNRFIPNTMFMDEFSIPHFPLDRPSGK